MFFNLLLQVALYSDSCVLPGAAEERHLEAAFTPVCALAQEELQKEKLLTALLQGYPAGRPNLPLGRFLTHVCALTVQGTGRRRQT